MRSVTEGEEPGQGERRGRRDERGKWGGEEGRRREGRGEGEKGGEGKLLCSIPQVYVATAALPSSGGPQLVWTF